MNRHSLVLQMNWIGQKTCYLGTFLERMDMVEICRTWHFNNPSGLHSLLNWTHPSLQDCKSTLKIWMLSWPDGSLEEITRVLFHPWIVEKRYRHVDPGSIFHSARYMFPCRPLFRPWISYVFFGWSMDSTKGRSWIPKTSQDMILMSENQIWDQHTD